MNPIAFQLQSFSEHFENLAGKKDQYNKPAMFLDYLWSTVRYGASASDFFDFEFYNKKHALRRTYLCYKAKKQMFHALNDYSKKELFDNKVEFLTRFSAYVERDWLDMTACGLDAFRAFCEKHNEMIAKPQNLSMGRGVHKVTVGSDVDALYRQLKDEKALVEEFVEQHPDMARIHPDSLNTVRLIAVKLKGRYEIFCTLLRCGVGDMVVDNGGSGGLLARIDPETGVVISDGCNKTHERFSKHPDSGVMLHGFQIPHWDKVLDICRRAMDEVPGVNYVGWDVAIKPDGVELIEGNFEGQLAGVQISSHEGYAAKWKYIMGSIR